MTRARIIRPSFFSSFTLAEVPRDARLFFAGLWVEADDEGRLIDSPRALAGAIFPHDDDITVEHVTAWIDDLERVCVVRRYAVDNGRYLVVANFKEHQKPPHPSPSRLPAPPDDVFASFSRNTREVFAKDSRISRETLAKISPLGLGFGFGVSDYKTSSTYTHQGHDERPNEEEDDETSRKATSNLDVIDGAFQTLAERHLARRTASRGHVTDPDAWLATAARKLQTDLADKLAEADFSLLTSPEQLADWLEPPRQTTPKTTPLDTTAAAARVLRERSEAPPCSTCGCRGGAGILEQPDGAVRCPDCNPTTGPPAGLAGSGPHWPAVALKAALARSVSSGLVNGSERRQDHNRSQVAKLVEMQPVGVGVPTAPHAPPGTPSTVNRQKEQPWNSTFNH